MAKVRRSTCLPDAVETVAVPCGRESALPVAARWTTSCWYPFWPAVPTSPTAKPTRSGPGTSTCTATIVRLRTLICTFRLLPAERFVPACGLSATIPATHCPGLAEEGTVTVNGTVSCVPGASRMLGAARATHVPGPVGAPLVR